MQVGGVWPRPEHRGLSPNQVDRPHPHMDRADVLAAACDLVARGRIEDARTSLLNQNPGIPKSGTRRTWSKKRLVRVFVRDGFTDRYFGDRLVFPGTLRALAILLPDAFPYHRNWKQSATHPAFWELYPTVDHVVPVARGGTDDEGNVAMTSMLHRCASKDA